MILSINRLLMSGYSSQAGREDARVYEEGLFVNPPFTLDSSTRFLLCLLDELRTFLFSYKLDDLTELLLS